MTFHDHAVVAHALQRIASLQKYHPTHTSMGLEMREVNALVKYIRHMEAQLAQVQKTEEGE